MLIEPLHHGEVDKVERICNLGDPRKMVGNTMATTELAFNFIEAKFTRVELRRIRRKDHGAHLHEG